MAEDLPGVKEYEVHKGVITVADQPSYTTVEDPLVLNDTKALAESAPSLKLVDPNTGEEIDENQNNIVGKALITATTNRKGYYTAEALEGMGLVELAKYLRDNYIRNIVAVKSNGYYKYNSPGNRKHIKATNLAEDSIWGFGKFDKIEEDINLAVIELSESIPVCNLKGKVVEQEFVGARRVLAAFPTKTLSSGEIAIDLDELEKRSAEFPSSTGENRLSVTIFSQCTIYSVQDLDHVIKASSRSEWILDRERNNVMKILYHFRDSLADHPHYKFNLTNDIDPIDFIPLLAYQFLEKIVVDVQQLSLAGYKIGNNSEENLHPEGFKDMDQFVKPFGDEVIDSEKFVSLVNTNLSFTVKYWRSFVNRLIEPLSEEEQIVVWEKIGNDLVDIPEFLLKMLA
ncbi:MAG: hypothetical protein Q9M91_05975 [Candidatus Dojkabacteria bacterium]|nr:hypothetical protein [Candidatus Dojkabacteria bacterium]MDQ7021347.1 hypothetical protein [Candidatus Dojkabacteria bacterium]